MSARQFRGGASLLFVVVGGCVVLGVFLGLVNTGSFGLAERIGAAAAIGAVAGTWIFSVFGRIIGRVDLADGRLTLGLAVGGVVDVDTGSVVGYRKCSIKGHRASMYFDISTSSGTWGAVAPAMREADADVVIALLASGHTAAVGRAWSLREPSFWRVVLTASALYVLPMVLVSIRVGGARTTPLACLAGAVGIGVAATLRLRRTRAAKIY